MIVSILILSYVKLLFYDLIDKISNSCGITYINSVFRKVFGQTGLYKQWIPRSDCSIGTSQIKVCTIAIPSIGIIL